MDLRIKSEDDETPRQSAAQAEGLHQLSREKRGISAYLIPLFPLIPMIPHKRFPCCLGIVSFILFLRDLKRGKRMKLSEKQAEIYQFIQSYAEERGVTPHTVEIQERFGYRANSTVIQHLKAIERKGYIKRLSKQKRSIVLLDSIPAKNSFSIPLRGVVPAGLLVEVFEEYEEVVIPEGVLRNRDSLYALEVRGDSMVEEHILSGDLVLIEERSHAKNGDIAVVCYEGGMTLKKYFQEKDHIRLQPANSTMEPILIRGDVYVMGVMVGLMRTYASKSID